MQYSIIRVAGRTAAKFVGTGPTYFSSCLCSLTEDLQSRQTTGEARFSLVLVSHVCTRLDLRRVHAT